MGSDLGPWEYFWCATLPFSTVLPAVLSTQQWIRSFASIQKFKFNRPSHHAASVVHRAGPLFLLTAAACLVGIGTWPNIFYPLVWISPLLVLTSLQMILREPHVFSETFEGDLRVIVSAALAALICGFFWEMWNYYSYAKWIYTIPYVHRFQIFEMPLLGYAGYLPFGLECVAISMLLRAARTKHSANAMPFLRYLAGLLAFMIGIWTAPHLWCQRGAMKWYEGESHEQSAMGQEIERWVHENLNRTSTGA